MKKNNIITVDFKDLIKDLNNVSFDPQEKTFTIDNDIHLKFTGNLYLDSDKHVIISSGKGLDPNRSDGVAYSIWFNAQLDENKQPIAETPPLPKKEWVSFNERKPCLRTHGRKKKCGCKNCGGH